MQDSIGMVGSGEAVAGEISAVIIRADGTREDLGVISAFDRNPIKHAFKQFQIWRRARRRKA